MLSKYRTAVQLYNKFEVREDQIHLASINQEFDFSLQPNVTCAGVTPRYSLDWLLDAESFPPTSSDYAERRYYLGLGEDGGWVSIIVHEMVCSEAQKSPSNPIGKSLES